MALQIALDLYLSARHFRKGDYFEGVCQMILAGGHMHQAIPQIKLMAWTWRYKPTMTGTLRQDERGFVYLDLPDEDLRALEHLYHEQNMELPPYFGKGRAGAHVSVMSANEIGALGGVKISEVGKEYTFRIASVDSAAPDRMKNVDRVHYLTLSCAERESLRARYGLSQKMDGHDFHFTFGIERSAV